MSHSILLIEKYPNSFPGSVKVKQIYGDELERNEYWSNDSKIIKSNSCDIISINEEKFEKILLFIDELINFIDILYDFNQLRHFIEQKPDYIKKALKSSELSPFIEFIGLTMSKKLPKN